MHDSRSDKVRAERTRDRSALGTHRELRLPPSPGADDDRPKSSFSSSTSGRPLRPPAPGIGIPFPSVISIAPAPSSTSIFELSGALSRLCAQEIRLGRTHNRQGAPRLPPRGLRSKRCNRSLHKTSQTASRYAFHSHYVLVAPLLLNAALRGSGW